MTEEVKKPTQLPEPKGYFLLCALVDASETFDSGLIKSSDTKRMEEISSPVLFVLRMGPEAYQDADKFPSGARCEEGDFVITRPYAGSRVKIYGKEFRLIADDQVEAVVDDPRGISRV
jgi:co-chaperonin GroES (HSP10)